MNHLICSPISTVTDDKTITELIGIEVHSAVTLKSTVFWDMMPRRPVDVDRCFVDCTVSIFGAE
jgi:hypothetical protein